MKKPMKALLTVMCALLLVVASVFTTMAYLTAQDTVTNTFTIGKVDIEVDEDDPKSDDPKDRVEKNDYTLMPGITYDKDPQVHVVAGSEDCWIFVKIDNGLAGLEITKSDNTNKTIADQMIANGWVNIASSGNTTVYAYTTKVEKSTEVQTVKTFTKFTTLSDVTATDLEDYDGNTIVVVGYAIQADGFDGYAAAWTALNTELSVIPTP